MPEPRAGLDHAAVLYDGEDDYAAAVLPFLQEGLEAGEPALVAVPGDRLALLRDGLAGTPVTLADMTEMGRNPARIIPAIRRFVDEHAGRRVRFVGEPIWPSRDGPALREATRHEALINLAFADAPVAILCPYDAGRLDAAVIEDAGRTHPLIRHRGHQEASPAYLDPASELPPSCEAPLPEPPGDADGLAVAAAADLRRLRHRVALHAARGGLAPAAIADVQLAVSEVATNALQHGDGGTLRVWRSGGSLLCQVDGGGRIADPLAGRRLPRPDARDGWGLLLANALCELVEVRTGAPGTSVRLHTALPGAR